MSCRRVRQRLKENGPSVMPRINRREQSGHNRLVQIDKPKFNSMFLRGPGSALMHINITRYHATPCAGCHATVKEMDDAGPEECLRRIDYFAQKMHENAKLKIWNRLLDFLAYNTSGLSKHKALIREAVNAHVSEVARKRGLSDT